MTQHFRPLEQTDWDWLTSQRKPTERLLEQNSDARAKYQTSAGKLGAVQAVLDGGFFGPDQSFGHAALSAYFSNVVRLIQAVHSMEVSDVWIDEFGDIAYAFFDFRMVADMAGNTEPLIVNDRSTIICHRVGGEWKGVHYHESEQGPPQPGS
jgi:ketosteroid isomerase-like protein